MPLELSKISNCDVLGVLFCFWWRRHLTRLFSYVMVIIISLDIGTWLHIVIVMHDA